MTFDIPIFTWPEYPVKYRETSAGIEARIEKALGGDESQIEWFARKDKPLLGLRRIK